MAAPLDPAILHPGDLIVYRPFEVLGWAIAVRTGYWYSHVEIVEMRGISTLSARADKGVNRYPWDWPKPGMALRPPAAFDWAQALAYFKRVQGQLYNYWALLMFLTPDPGLGQHCSQFAVNLYRAGGVPVFGATPAVAVVPGAFTGPEVGFTVLWRDKD